MSSTTRYTVPSISCGHCTQTIEDRVAPVEGVESVSADVDTKLVTVVGGDTDAVAAAISGAGFEISETTAG